MNRNSTFAAFAATAFAFTAASALPASAADNSRSSIVFEQEPVASCSGGETITLGFDIVRNIHLTYDESGEPTLMRRNVNFTGILQVEGTDREHTFQGAIMFTADYVTGLFTRAGNQRSVTQPGLGKVIQDAGRTVADIEDPDNLYFSAGPKESDLTPDELNAAYCGVFSLAS